MTDGAAKRIAGVLLIVAALSLLPGVPAVIQVPAVVTFAFVAPGLAASRFLPTVGLTERLALTFALSISMVILVSLLLVALNQWGGLLTFAELTCITIALIAFPPPQSAEQEAQAPPTTALTEPAAPAPAASPASAREPAAPAQIRAAAPLPAKQPAPEPESVAPVEQRPLADIHRRARSSDPVERRAGLVELADVLEAEGESSWATELRALAAQPIEDD
jgi:hypothetical protein